MVLSIIILVDIGKESKYKTSLTLFSNNGQYISLEHYLQ
jgi:hypothetical protein